LAGFFFFRFGLLKGFGTALFGTRNTVFNALSNLADASGPSIISGCGLGRDV